MTWMRSPRLMARGDRAGARCEEMIRRDLLDLLERCSRADGVQIFIGEEAGYEVFGDFSVVADFLYMALGDSSDSGLIRRADVDQLIVDVTGGYRFSNNVEAFAGMRFTDISTKIGLGDPIRREFEPAGTSPSPARERGNLAVIPGELQAREGDP